MPIAGMDKMQTKSHENQDSDDLQHHHNVVGFGGFANSAHQYDGEQHHDNERRPVETEMPAGTVKWVALQVTQAARKVSRDDPAHGWVNAEPVQKIDYVRGEAHADGHVRNCVLEN